MKSVKKKKKVANKLTEMIRVRMTAKQKKRLFGLAESQGMTVSKLIRRKVLKEK